MALDPRELDERIDAALAPEGWNPAWDGALDESAIALHLADGSTTTVAALRLQDSDAADAAVEGFYEVKLAWQIDGERTAEWAMRRVRHAVAERAAAKDLADVLRAEADFYEATIEARTESTVDFFSGKLRHYHEGILATQPRALTVHHPSGDLSRRAGGLSLVVTDEAAAVAALEDTPYADTVLEYPDPKVKKNPAKDAFGAKAGTEPGYYPAFIEASGEVIPGLKIVRAMPSETLKFVDGTTHKLATPEVAPEADEPEATDPSADVATPDA